MAKFDVAIDFGSYYADGIEAVSKEEAEKIALEQFKDIELTFDYEICNINVDFSDNQ